MREERRRIGKKGGRRGKDGVGGRKKRGEGQKGKKGRRKRWKEGRGRKERREGHEDMCMAKGTKQRGNLHGSS